MTPDFSAAGALAGRRVAFTGHSPVASRAEFRRRVEASGGVYVPAVDDAVDVLVVGQQPLVARIERARRLGVAVVAERSFWEVWRNAAPEPCESSEPSMLSLEALPEGLRILDVVLPTQRARASPLRAFTLDEPSLRMLRFLAAAVLAGHPARLDGPSGSGKRSAIQYLAALTGNRLHVPRGRSTAACAAALRRAAAAGGWLVIDGVDNAPRSTLELLGPYLDPAGWNARGDVHPTFRLFAIADRAEYDAEQGSADDPAWPARWSCRPAGEREWGEMLDRWIFGIQPSMRIDAVGYAGPREAPCVDGLAGLSGIEPFLAACAAAQAGLCVALSGVSFGRAAVARLVDALCGLRVIGARGTAVSVSEEPRSVAIAAIASVYLDPWPDEDRRQSAMQVLRAFGLARQGFAFFAESGR